MLRIGRDMKLSTDLKLGRPSNDVGGISMLEHGKDLKRLKLFHEFARTRVQRTGGEGELPVSNNERDAVWLYQKQRREDAPNLQRPSQEFNLSI